MTTHSTRSLTPAPMPIYNPPSFRCSMPMRSWSALHAPIKGGPTTAQVITRLDAQGSGQAIVEFKPRPAKMTARKA